MSLRGTHASAVSVEGRPGRPSKAKGHASAHSLTWAAPAVYGRDSILGHLLSMVREEPENWGNGGSPPDVEVGSRGVHVCQTSHLTLQMHVSVTAPKSHQDKSRLEITSTRQGRAIHQMGSVHTAVGPASGPATIHLVANMQCRTELERLPLCYTQAAHSAKEGLGPHTRGRGHHAAP